jgi:hypothetical protein
LCGRRADKNKTDQPDENEKAGHPKEGTMMQRPVTRGWLGAAAVSLVGMVVVLAHVDRPGLIGSPFVTETQIEIM